MLYLCRYGKLILIHNYTCIFVNVYLLCIYYIFTVYFVYKLTFFSCMFFFVISQTCYLSSTHLQLTCLVYFMGTLMWYGGGFFLSLVRNFLHVVHILFFVVHILLYIPQTFFNIIYFVGIAYYITCTFACEFSINFFCRCLL